MTYKVTVNGKEIEYGPLVERSSFSEEEWQAIHQEIVKQNQPEVFSKAFGSYVEAENEKYRLQRQYPSPLYEVKVVKSK